MHVMIDLETMGTAADAPILAVGAVRFTADTGVVGSAYWLVDGESDISLGAKPSWDTFMWWLRQADMARAELADSSKPRVSITQALHALSLFIRDTPNLEGVWGNGASFDNALLAAAYRRAKVEFPYDFRLDRCFRTLRALYPLSQLPVGKTAHNALSDAVWQADAAARILSEHVWR